MFAETVPSEVIKHGREYWQEDHVDVVETGGTASDGSLDVTETSHLQVGHCLCEVVCRKGEERQEGRSNNLRAVPHNSSGTPTFSHVNHHQK